MNRAKRNAIREAIETIDNQAAELARLRGELATAKRQNAALKGTITKLRRKDV